MSTLAAIYCRFNRKVYDRYVTVPKKAEDQFQRVEQILTRSGVKLDDYALTTFADRTWIGQQKGYLPWQVFVSIKSLNRYIARLEQGAEVSRQKEPTRNALSMELALGEATIGVLLEGLTYTDDFIEEVAQVHPGWSNDCRRPIAEAECILSAKYQTPAGSYQDIAQHIKIRRTRAKLARMEPRLSVKGNRPAARSNLVV